MVRLRRADLVREKSIVYIPKQSEAFFVLLRERQIIEDRAHTRHVEPIDFAASFARERSALCRRRDEEERRLGHDLRGGRRGCEMVKGVGRGRSGEVERLEELKRVR